MRIAVEMPNLGHDIETGKIVAWVKNSHVVKQELPSPIFYNKCHKWS